MSSTSPIYVPTSPAPISYPSPRGSDQDSASQSASLSPRVPSPKLAAEGAAVESYTFQPAPQRSATTRSAAVISYTFQPAPVYRIPRSAPAPPVVSQPTPNTRQQIPAVASGRVTRPTFRCLDCRVTCNSRAAFVDHLRGRKHAIARLRRIGLPQCEDCNQVFEARVTTSVILGVRGT